MASWSSILRFSYLDSLSTLGERAGVRGRLRVPLYFLWKHAWLRFRPANRPPFQPLNRATSIIAVVDVRDVRGGDSETSRLQPVQQRNGVRRPAFFNFIPTIFHNSRGPPPAANRFLVRLRCERRPKLLNAV